MCTHVTWGCLNKYDVPGQLLDIRRNLRYEKLLTFGSQEPSTTDAPENRFVCICRYVREMVNLLVRALRDIFAMTHPQALYTWYHPTTVVVQLM